ncbi:OsmC family protein [Thermococcus sp. Bubb.Bath]|uniref:OsmC family protein n=1 Tax=Thermococcus sp. Bubb.Bath TaxID=1638242 RepID=UPI001438DF02|nr:OsmC family protein [Thermococcus sp. Bubb.Bath]NJF25882.1 osmotically inducible protein OsmC [Thermococcus sp. Bubb.Bath]
MNEGEIDFKAAAELLAATSTWIGDGRTKTRLSKTELEVDNPLSVPPMNPEDNMTWPEQLLPASLAACFITTMTSISERMRVNLKSLQVTVKPLLAKDSDGGFKFDKMFITIELSVPQEDRPKVKRLVELTHRYCLISKAIKGNVKEVIETKVHEV